MLRGHRVELLPTPAALAQWWMAARRQYPEVAATGSPDVWQSEELRAAAIELRAHLRVIFDAVAAGRAVGADEVQPLNVILELGYHVLAPTAEGGVVARYGLHGTAVRGALLPIALSALYLLTQAEASRLRACENPRCVALFYDTGRSGTRRWCGEDCMNRARSAQRYAQIKRATADA